MSRIRQLRPSWWDLEEYGRLTIGARILYLGMRTVSDDEGRGVARVATLRRRVHFYATDVSDSDVELSLGELTASGVVRVYESDGERYFELRDFRSEERIAHPTPSKIPPPPTSVKESDKSVPFKDTPDANEPCLSIFRIWNEESHYELPRVSSISESRREKARARWQENPDSSYWSNKVKDLNAEHQSGVENINVEFLLLPP